jgi:hypothetical protein
VRAHAQSPGAQTGAGSPEAQGDLSWRWSSKATYAARYARVRDCGSRKRLEMARIASSGAWPRLNVSASLTATGPGNVRHLANVMEAAVFSDRRREIEARDLADGIATYVGRRG